MRSRPARGRPTWWAILAVSLALMALVAATATRANNPGAPKLATQTGSTSATTTTRPRLAATTTTLPALVATSTPTTLVRLGSSSSSGGSAASHMVDATTTTTAPAPPPTTTTTTTTIASSEAVYPGYLQPPNDTSTTYRFTGTGPTTVSVTWSSSTYLSLNVTCSGFNQTTGGSSVISLSIPNAQGTCQAVLSEPSPATSEVSYTLTVDPTGG